MDLAVIFGIMGLAVFFAGVMGIVGTMLNRKARSRQKL